VALIIKYRKYTRKRQDIRVYDRAMILRVIYVTYAW